jgi:molecular chaperone GrpE
MSEPRNIHPKRPSDDGRPDQQPTASGPTPEPEREPGPAEPRGEAPPQGDEGLREQVEIDELLSELDHAKDRALRCQAELDNYRKRMMREMESERRYANLPLLRDVLPVLDNVRRAIEAAESSPDPAGLLEGFRMVRRQLEDVLRRHHCLEIEALHAPFDPHLHEAIAQQPSEEHPPHTVILVTQPGYRLHDRVVRPSQVIVSAASDEPE